MLFVFLIPSVVYGQLYGGGGGGTDPGNLIGSGGGLDSVSTNTPPVTDLELSNPLVGIDTIGDFIKNIFDLILKVGIPIVALFIIYSGFLFVAAQGNSEKLKKAKETFIYTIIGAAILLGAWVIAQAVSGTVSELST